MPTLLPQALPDNAALVLGLALAAAAGAAMGVALESLAWRRRIVADAPASRHRTPRALVGVVGAALCATAIVVPRGGLARLEALVLAGVLLEVSLVDAYARVIPNGALLVAMASRLVAVVSGSVLSGGGAAMAFLAVGGSVAAGLALSAPALLLSLAMDYLRGGRSLGGGDVKLLFVVGACLGWWTGLVATMVGCLLGVIWGISSRLRLGGWDGTFAFGPCVALGCVVAGIAGSLC